MLQGARRQQLVMADRAFGLVNLLEKQGHRPDTAMWNALVECAGFSGQLTRAFSVLQDMKSGGCRPNARTFVALLTACNGVRIPGAPLPPPPPSPSLAGTDTKAFVAACVPVAAPHLMLYVLEREFPPRLLLARLQAIA